MQTIEKRNNVSKLITIIRISSLVSGVISVAVYVIAFSITIFPFTASLSLLFLSLLMMSIKHRYMRKFTLGKRWKVKIQTR